MIPECTLALLSFTVCLHWTEYTHNMEREKKDMKLKHTTKSWNWVGSTRFFKPECLKSDWAYLKPIPVSSLFYLHFVCVLSLSPFFFSFLLQLLCTNMKKQLFNHLCNTSKQRPRIQSPPPPPQKKIYIKNNNNNNSGLNKTRKKALTEWHSEEKWALQVKSHCQRLRHTNVVFVKFTS